MRRFLLILLFSVFSNCSSKDYDIELIKDNYCDCRDFYGACRTLREKWVDDQVWMYECKEKGDATFVGCKKDNNQIEANMNKTIDGLWHSCEQDMQKLKFEIEGYCEKNNKRHKVGELFRDASFQWICLSTGLWVTGCYYSNETHNDLLLNIGQKAYNGLIEHVCDKRQDHPAVVQYYAKVRNDVDVKHPTNKGHNQNWPQTIVATFSEKDTVKWQHNLVDYFVANKQQPRVYIRYLPASRKPFG